MSKGAQNSKRYREKLKANGLCQHCHRPLSEIDKGHIRCVSCREMASTKRRQQTQEKRLFGLCECGKPVLENLRVCEVCWFRRIAKFATGSQRNGGMVRELFYERGAMCPYSGNLLIIGNNASLDHIIPKSQGGDGSLSNLQWVDAQINRMKNDMTHQEFISTIRNILTIVDDDELLEDGFGAVASPYCTTCGQKSIYIVRPGDFRCANCDP